MAVLRHVADADEALGMRIVLRRPAAAGRRSRISPPLSGRMPASASSSSDWPLPATPATPRISPSRRTKETPSTRDDAAVVAHDEVARLERDLARMRLALVDLEDHLAADHGVGELGRRGLRGVEGRDHLAAPHHRDAVGEAHDLAQLVGDEDDRLVLALQHPEHLEQLIGLGRRQHRGRLVEHQDFRAAHQRLQDLDPLLQPDRQVRRRSRRDRPRGRIPCRARRAACGSRSRPGRAAGRPRRRASRSRARSAAAPA